MDADETMRRRKMLIHSTTTTIQSTSITEQGGASVSPSTLSYYVHVNGKGDDPAVTAAAGGAASVNATIVSPVLRSSSSSSSSSSTSSSSAYRDKPKERLPADGFTASRRKKPHAAAGSLEDGGLVTPGSTAHLKDRLLSLHHTSLWWRVKERGRRLLSPLARLLGLKALDTKKTDEDDGYFSANARKRLQSPPTSSRRGGGTVGKSGACSCGTVLRSLLVVAVLLTSLSILCSYFPNAPLLASVASLLPLLLPSPAPSLPPVASGPPYTIISLLHDMNAAYRSEHRDGYVFQFNAVRSWLRLVPASHIFLYMDTQQSCDHLLGLVPDFRLLHCQPVPCANAEYQRPRLDCLFNHANENAETDIIAFVNGDIVLQPYLNTVLLSVSQQYGQHFSMVSRRTDTEIDNATMDSWAASVLSTDHTDAVISLAERSGHVHSEWGIDLFVYTRSLFATLDFPPFLAGVYRWDNWLLTTLILKDDTQVVDATTPGLVIHQQMVDREAAPHPNRTGSSHNDLIVKEKIGSLYKIGHINNAHTIVRGRCPDCQFAANPNISLHVHLAKYAQPSSKWVVVVPVSTGQELDVYHAFCYYEKLGLQRHYFFLARDQAVYDALRSKKIPVVSQLQVLEGSGAGAVQAKSRAGELALQEHDFFNMLLRLNYNFLYLEVSSLILTDPVQLLSSLEHDVMVKKVTVGATVINNEYSSAAYAVRSSTQSQYFWHKVRECRQLNDAMAQQRLWADCIAQQFSKIGGLLKKGFLEHFLFPDMGSALIDRWPQLNGYYPLVLVSNASLAANPAARRDLLRDWKLSATSREDPTSCSIVHPPLFSPPTSKKQTEWKLKIRVLTFDRFDSLSRLLTSLNEANYDGDSGITLEIAVDLPVNASSGDEVLERNQRTAEVARAFQWHHGPSAVVQQEQHKGLVGQWTTGWQPAASNTEILLVLEDDTVVSPHYYAFTRKMVQTYYLDPEQYDPRMFGFALQLQHTILGETLKERYGSRRVQDIVPRDSLLYRYQLVGTWGGVFFPQHWREFVTWLREKQFQPASGTSALGFKPCVPCVLSNEWWANRTAKVWSQWFVRFAYEQGWYNLYTNFPPDPSQSSPAFDSNHTALVGNFREAGDNFNHTKGLMNPLLLTLSDDLLRPLPPLSSLPLYDLHFHPVASPAQLSLRNAIYNEQFVPACWTMKEFIARKKQQEEHERLQEEKRRLKDENKRRQQLGLKPLTSYAQMVQTAPPQPPAAPAALAAPAPAAQPVAAPAAAARPVVAAAAPAAAPAEAAASPAAAAAAAANQALLHLRQRAGRLGRGGAAASDAATPKLQQPAAEQAPPAAAAPEVAAAEPEAAIGIVAEAVADVAAEAVPAVAGEDAAMGGGQDAAAVPAAGGGEEAQGE